MRDATLLDVEAAVESANTEMQCNGRVTELVIGNGTVTTEYLVDLLCQAQAEVLFSTCFWAASPSLSLLHDALVALNMRCRQERRRVIVRIMFSSYSFRQKFLSFRGTRVWKSDTWANLGLPVSLECLDMTVFSRFRKPFGVMHAKFLVIDRAVVIMPSSNISWENWYEIAVRLEGEIVRPFLEYFFHYYYPTGSAVPPCAATPLPIVPSSALRNQSPTLIYPVTSSTLPITFLSRGPSRLGALPFAPIKTPPPLFQIEAIINARRTIFIQTPNLNSRALIRAIRQALLNKVLVTLYLPRNMMVLESLVTGWSTTKCQISFLQRWARRNHLNLEVHWFKSDPAQPFAIDEDKSHIKFMVIDEELVVLGSSNLDRASACTSGEVNIAISNADLAKQFVSTIRYHQLTGRLNV